MKQLFYCERETTYGRIPMGINSDFNFAILLQIFLYLVLKVKKQGKVTFIDRKQGAPHLSMSVDVNQFYLNMTSISQADKFWQVTELQYIVFDFCMRTMM